MAKSCFNKAAKNARKAFHKRTAKKGMGFKAAQHNIMERGYDKESAGAILASSARKASPFAKKQNPNLKKVK